MLRLDPPDHTRLRGLVSKVFTPRYVARLHDHVAAIVDRLIDDVRGAGEVDFISAFAFELPITIICDMLGVPTERRADFRQWTVALAQALEPLPPDDVQDAADAAPIKIGELFHELIAQRRSRPGDDPLYALITAEEEGHTASQRTRLCRPRRCCSAPASRRRPTCWATDCSCCCASPISGKRSSTIPPGSHPQRSRSCCATTVRNAVDLRRPDPNPLSFGRGPHFCLGASLARLEGAVAFERLAASLPQMTLVDDDPQWRRALNLRGLESLRSSV